MSFPLKLKIKEVLPPALLLGMCLVVSFANYTPQTFLTGWDNLHPEFNIKLNLFRGIFSVWEEYQGLGLMAGNAHSANILHTLFAGFLSILSVPVNMARYFYHFSMFTVGVLGVYFLLKKIKFSNMYSFAGALFYGLNLGAVQVFYAPYISFSHFYGFLPYLFCFMLGYVHNNSRKNLLMFGLTAFLVAPSFYIPTIFVVFILCTTIFGLMSFPKKVYLAKVLAIIFAVNSFWVFPFAYFIISSLLVRYNSLSSVMSSELLFLENRKYGSLVNTLILKGFWFGNVDLQLEQGKFDYMMRPWITHIQQTPVLIIGYILSAMVFLGFAVAIVRLISKKYKVNTPLAGFAGIFLISLFFLLNENPPLGFLYRFIRQASPLFAEVFRFPFTKWVVPATLSFSVFFAFGVDFVMSHLRLRKGLTPIVVSVISVLLVIWMFPVFRGNLIYPNLKANIPSEYFELFDFFKTIPKTERIANFPQYTFWGWNYYKWGYRGSGFLWYGIEQPILDRAFDVWNVQNENYYKDVSYALYSKNEQIFYDVLNKYQINWVLLDTNVIQPEGVLESLYISELQALLESNPKVVLAKEFGGIKVYKVILNYFPQNFLYFPGITSDYNVIRGDVSEINAGIVQNGGEGYSVNFSAPLKISKKDILTKYFEAENTVLAEVFAKLENASLDIKIAYKIPSLPDQEVSLGKIANISAMDNLILAVNSSQFIHLDNIANIYKSYGRVLMPARTDTVLNLYNGNADYVKKFDPKYFIDIVYSCADFKDNSQVLASLEDGAIKLSGKYSAPCFLLKETMVKSDEYNLVSVSYDYRSYAEELPEYCFLTNSSGKCLNNKFGNRPRSSLSWNSYTDFVEYSKSRYTGEVFLAFALDAYDAEKTIWYKDIQLNFYPLVFSETIKPFEFLVSSYGEEENLDIKSIKFGRDYFVYNINAMSNLHSQYARNCDRFNKLFVDKQITEGALIYYSKNAVNCEDFELLNLPQAIGYVFVANATNLKGLPLSFCISNSLSKRCDIVQKAKNGENYLVLPATSSDLRDLGFIFHLDSASIGDAGTVNKLDNILVYYYPSLFVKSFFETRVGDKLEPAASVIKNSVRYNPSLYKIAVKLSSGKSTLVFGQSFDKGWVLLDWDRKGLLKGHKIVNGWANGWDLICGEEGSCVKTLYVFYWPQVLEFVGFAVLFAYVAAALIKRE